MQSSHCVSALHSWKSLLKVKEVYLCLVSLNQRVTRTVVLIFPLTPAALCDFPSGDRAWSSVGCSLRRRPHGGAGEVRPVSSRLLQPWWKGLHVCPRPLADPAAPRGSRLQAASESWSQLLSTGDGPSRPSAVTLTSSGARRKTVSARSVHEGQMGKTSKGGFITAGAETITRLIDLLTFVSTDWREKLNYSPAAAPTIWAFNFYFNKNWIYLTFWTKHDLRLWSLFTFYWWNSLYLLQHTLNLTVFHFYHLYWTHQVNCFQVETPLISHNIMNVYLILCSSIFCPQIIQLTPLNLWRW